MFPTQYCKVIAMSSKVDQKKKKQKVSLDSPLNNKWFNKEESSRIRKEHDASSPYKHSVLEELCQDDRMRKIHDELTHNMKANFKETDLFKVFQTADLAALDSDLEKKMPHLLSLRKAIYSSEFREFVTEITGCGDLTDRVDCSCNAYAHSCHLLCHDDVIGTRRVSYIIYLSDPDDPWQVIDGGAVELYPLLESSVVNGKGNQNGDNRQGIPENVPTRALLPTFNTMLIFAVQPGRSYHSVQEVFSSTKPRLSISGWYHATTAPEGSDKSSLKQIMTLGDDHRLFTTFPSAAATTTEEVPVLSKKEIKQLSQWINPNYLTAAAMKDINEQFCANSSLQLNDFIRSDAAYKLTQALITADNVQHCGHGAPQLDYSVGRSAHWELVGPPHKRRHLLYNTDAPSNAPSTDDRKLSDQVGKQLDDIRREIFRSPVFAKYLQVITELQPLAHRDEVRRFRPGLDYTVAHYGVLTKEVRLDATLCFVNDDKEIQDRVLSGDSENPDATAKVVKSAEKPKAGKSKPAQESDDDEEDNSSVDEEEEEEPEMGFDEVWDGGEVGGFECYIEAEEDPENAEAAEVYRSSYGKDKSKDKSDEDEEDNSTSLLSVSACNNTLNLVMRDEGVMRFVKYVSAAAPGSRWDIAVEYEIAPPVAAGDSDSDEEDSEMEEEEEEG